MNADERRSRQNDLSVDELTEGVIGCAYAVSNTLGTGFLEKIYENALIHELKKAGLDSLQQVPVNVHYDNVVVGEYQLDLLVDNRLVLELKAVKNIDPTHIAQTINYLKATHHNIGLILNFGNPKLQIKRLVHNYQ